VEQHCVVVERGLSLYCAYGSIDRRAITTARNRCRPSLSLEVNVVVSSNTTTRKMGAVEDGVVVVVMTGCASASSSTSGTFLLWRRRRGLPSGSRVVVVKAQKAFVAVSIAVVSIAREFPRGGSTTATAAVRASETVHTDCAAHAAAETAHAVVVVVDDGSLSKGENHATKSGNEHRV